MRLINTASLELEEFENTEGLRYAILSHRWATEEVLFADMGRPEQLQRKIGFKKLKDFCIQVAAKGLTYGWMDTCCIDKSSSAELSEAINSMWHWYSNAEICLVFLADVSVSSIESQFPHSEWFERGWTLQELLAPSNVDFYNAEWLLLGSKSNLSGALSSKTGIPEVVIQRRKPIQKYCIAERMSWAAFRKTSRIEDRAYSLLGIFDVNMPLLYGEAEKAFTRLQEEIIKDSNDQTIFDWTEPAVDQYTIPSIFPPSGLLASSPHSFRHWHGKMYEVSFPMSGKLFPHTYTSCGLLVRFNLVPYKCGIFVAVLDYFRQSDDGLDHPCIFLRMLNFQQQYARVVVDRFHLAMFSQLNATDMTLSINEEFRQVQLQREIYVPQKRYKLYNSATLGLIEALTCSITLKNKVDTLQETPQVMCVRQGQLSQGKGSVKFETHRPGTVSILRLQSRIPSAEPSTYKILLGLDPELSLICIIVDETIDAIERANNSYGRRVADDVSTKQLEDVTCIESSGWSTVEERHHTSKVVGSHPERPGFWAFRIEGFSLFRCHLQKGPISLEIIKRLTSSRLACSISLL